MNRKQAATLISTGVNNAVFDCPDGATDLRFWVHATRIAFGYEDDRPAKDFLMNLSRAVNNNDLNAAAEIHNIVLGNAANGPWHVHLTDNTNYCNGCYKNGGSTVYGEQAKEFASAWVSASMKLLCQDVAEQAEDIA